MMTWDIDVTWQKGIDNEKGAFAIKNTATECSTKLYIYLGFVVNGEQSKTILN